MRVYTVCKNCGEKIYLDDVRDRRSDYPSGLQLNCSSCDHSGFYSRNDLEAEKSTNSTAMGTLLGGAAGALAGPIGVALGAGIGSAMGNASDKEEEEKVEEFYERDIFFE